MSMPRDFQISKSKREMLLELVESEISPFYNEFSLMPSTFITHKYILVFILIVYSKK